MKSTENFKNVISGHLKSVAANDPLFAKNLEKPKKNIDDCVTYILNTVKNSGASGFEDSEIFGMAIHYYDEDDVKPGKKIQVKIISNHKVESDVVKVKSDVVKPAPTKTAPVKKLVIPENQTSLF
jgi:hypothetical protein